MTTPGTEAFKPARPRMVIRFADWNVTLQWGGQDWPPPSRIYTRDDGVTALWTTDPRPLEPRRFVPCRLHQDHDPAKPIMCSDCADAGHDHGIVEWHRASYSQVPAHVAQTIPNFAIGALYTIDHPELYERTDPR